MIDCEEGFCEDMIVADPNMILSVTVPETVQKQAEKWQRGTRTVQHKSVLRSGRTYHASHEHDSEGKLHLSSPSGQETDQHDEPTDNTTLKHKCSKHSSWLSEQRVRFSENFGKVPSSDTSHDRHKPAMKQSQGKPRQPAFTCTNSHSDCDNINPSSVDRACSQTHPFRHQHVQQVKPPEDSKSVATTGELMNNSTDVKCSLPLQAFGKDSKIRGSDAKTTNGLSSSCTVSDSPAPNKDSDQLEALKHQKDLQQEHGKPVQAASAVPPRSSHVGDSLTRSTKETSPGPKKGAYGRDGPKLQQTTTTSVTATKHSRQTVAARSSMRVRYRQWMDSKRAASSSDRESNHPKQTCYRYSMGRRTLSRRGEELQHQTLFAATWPQPRSIDSSNTRAEDSLTSCLRQSHDVILGLCDVAETSGSDDLMDLSVEETVEFFLSMTSPLLVTECVESAAHLDMELPSENTTVWGVQPQFYRL